MAVQTARGNVRLLRGILRELRLAHDTTPVQKTAQYAFVMDQFRRHQVTPEKICRGHNEVEHLCDTYRCLLESARKHEELRTLYAGRGERTIEESANIVGLNLPLKYTDPET